jgi:hypothetical protein
MIWWGSEFDFRLDVCRATKDVLQKNLLAEDFELIFIALITLTCLIIKRYSLVETRNYFLNTLYILYLRMYKFADLEGRKV